MARSRRIFREAQHPRDDRGRFARKGGGKWVARVVRTADAGFLDTGQARSGLRQGGPSGLINLGQVREENKPWVKRAADRIGEQRGTLKTARDVSMSKDQILVDGVWRTVTMTGWGGGKDKLGYRDDDDVSREIRLEADEKIATRPTKIDFSDPLRPGQAARMAAWRANAAVPPPFRMSTVELPSPRELRVAALAVEREMAVATLKAAQRFAKARARRKYPNSEGYGAYTRDSYVENETHREQWAVNSVDNQFRYLADNDSDTGDWNVRPTGMVAELIAPLDPARPLAVYGDLMNIEGDDQATFRHLRDLELLPAEAHAIVAAGMARTRAEKGSPSTGVWLGSRSIAELDHSDDLAKERPRGWDEDKTWSNVDGVYRGTTQTMIAGTSEVSASRGEHGQAALHEFGHAIDDEIGQRRALAGKRGESESHAGPESFSREWGDLWSRVVAAAPDMSPYFKQGFPAGQQELWAEAFGEWSRARARARKRGEHPDLISVVGQNAFTREFRIPKENRALAIEMDTYFLGVMERFGVKL
jgi:hypothetical protein